MAEHLKWDNHKGGIKKAIIRKKPNRKVEFGRQIVDVGQEKQGSLKPYPVVRRMQLSLGWMRLRRT